MLAEVARSMEECSEEERAKLARFLAAQAEENLSYRPGVSRILAWLGVVAAGRQPHAISLEEISEIDRSYVRDLAATLQKLVRDEAALRAADTPDDLERTTAADGRGPVEEVWWRLADVMHRSLQETR